MLPRVLLAIAALVAVAAAAPAPQATPPPGFTDSLVAEVARPTAIAFTPDGRALVTTQTGRLRVIRGGVLLDTPALDLSERICDDSERGLLGVAVDPGFPARPYVFLYYTFRKHPGCERRNARVPLNRLSRFTLHNDVVDPASELVLLDNIPSFNGNHNAGDVQFGPDGLLYVTVGDGGCDYAGGGCLAANDAARDRHALLGKVLRLTRDGEIPSENPWQGPNSVRCASVGVAEPGSECRETFAWGLRNPFRIAFDTEGRSFAINDVGDRDWEEIDRGVSGADYGWNEREGPCRTRSRTDCGPPPAGVTNPVFAYPHGDGCFSITGGAFVPKAAWPAPYDGAYLFADLGCGIFRLEQTGNRFTRRPFVPDLEGVVHMTFGPWRGGQALYYTTYSGGGEVRRIVHDGARRVVVRSFSVTRSARPGQTVTARLELSGVSVARIACAARAGRTALRGTRSVRRSSAGVVATCTWRVPDGAAGRTLRGTVTITAGTTRVSRSFSRRIVR